MPSAIFPFRDFPAAMQVMLLAVRSRQNKEEIAELHRLCTPVFPWPHLLELTLHHSLTSLVHTGLERCCPELIPPPTRKILKQRSMANAFRAFDSMREAARLSDALAAASFPVAVLKGIPLSQQLYGSPHARHVGDLDLLTSAPDLNRSLPGQLALMESLGYRRINPLANFTPRRLRSYLRFWKDVTFQHSTEGFHVDLHWRFFNHRMHPANRILSKAHFDSLSALGCTVRVLCLRDQFLHVIAHGVSDAWIYLKSLADVAGFLALFTPAELEDALALAAELGLLAQVSAAIHLSNEWMGSGISSPTLFPRDHPPADQLHRSVSRLLRKHSFMPVRDDRTPAAWIRLERAQIPGVRALAENCRRFLWRPRVWKRFGLPDRLFWLYPAISLLLPPRIDSWWRKKPTSPGLNASGSMSH